MQSKWQVNHVTTDTIMRASTLKPRLDYATALVDKTLDMLIQKRSELRKINLSLYAKTNNGIPISEFKEKLVYELEISRAIESLR
ncbi:MAG TPA: hypothetical protein VJJ25_02665 [Nitrosopumilaceae archaeon]|nr:hypothetical protein [Nitrosopumilaceae archaeon]